MSAIYKTNITIYLFAQVAEIIFWLSMYIIAGEK